MSTSTTTSLRWIDSARKGPLERARDLALKLASDEGLFQLQDPDLCIYRFSAPMTYRKAATYGVTLGAVLQGAKRLRFGESELTVDPTRLVVVTRESEHDSAVVDATPARPFLGFCLCFGPERVARALLALAEAGGPPVSEADPAFTLECDESIANAIERLLLALSDPLDRKLIAPLAVDEILFRLLRTPAAAAVRAGVGPAGDATRILESMQFIRRHHTDKLSVDHLARAAAMSPSHFAHRFRAVARVSPMRYLRQVRLDAARTLLLENGSRVSQVAIDVGFESPAHFTREFKRRFGVSPSRALAPLASARA